MSNLAFVLEEIMGHRTHGQNLERTVAADASVQGIHINVPGDCRWSDLPLIRSNYIYRVSLAAYLGLRPQMRRLDAALFHTQATSLFSAGLMRRLPSVISLDATPTQFNAFRAYGGPSPKNGRLTALKERIYRYTFGQAQGLVTWSQWAADSLTADYGVPAEKITVVAPGVDTQLYQPAPAVHSGDGVVRILFVGAHFERKGGELLLRWARETRVSVPWEIHVVTHEWPQETPNVFIHHSIANNSPELIRLYQQSDLFALPTFADCYSMVAMEAMASGLPVVVSRVGGIGEMVSHGLNGMLTESNDFAGLSAALDTLVTDAALRQSMGREARRTALAQFNSQTNYRNLVESVKAVVPHKTAQPPRATNNAAGHR